MADPLCFSHFTSLEGTAAQPIERKLIVHKAMYSAVCRSTMLGVVHYLVQLKQFIGREVTSTKRGLF